MIGNDRVAEGISRIDAADARGPLRSALQRKLHHLGAGLVVLASTGCHDAPRTSDPAQGLMVFVDLETQEPVVDLATTEVPAVNPATGNRTLMPGLYCPSCQRWHPTPPYDKLQRSPGAGRCPTDGTPLTSDGPWPTGEK